MNFYHIKISKHDDLPFRSEIEKITDYPILGKKDVLRVFNDKFYCVFDPNSSGKYVIGRNCLAQPLLVMEGVGGSIIYSQSLGRIDEDDARKFFNEFGVEFPY